VEIAPEYVDVAIKRFQQNHPGVPVTLLATGQSFDEVAADADRRSGMNWLADKIEQWPTAKLLPYARNARTHSDDQVAQIAASIAEFGFTNPILAGSDGIIVAGHGRLAAAQKLGLEIVPVVVLDHLSPTQRRAWSSRTTASPRTQAGTTRCCASNRSLQDDDFDLSLTGFDADALAELMAGDEPDNEGQTDDDAVPSGETPISRPGDVWIWVAPAAVRRLDRGRELRLQGEQVDMVFTDPPYNVNYANSAKDKMRGKDRAILNDNLGDGFYDFLLAATPTVAHCRGGIYVAMSSSELDVLQAAFRAAGGKWSTFIIWAKNTFTLGRADYQRQYEPILYGWPEGAQRHWCGDRDQGDVWNIKKPQKNDLHPTMKPVELVERAIRNSSRPGNVVLDPFGGSGTTLIAAEKSGRLARLIELDPYADVIVRRWQDWTASRPPARRMARVRSGGERLVGDLAVNHKARQVRQAARDAVLLAGLAANRPAHPLLGGGVDRVCQGLAPVQPVLDVVGKVASVAAVEEDPHRFEGLAGGVRMALIARATRRWRVRSSCPKSPRLRSGWRGSGGGHLGLLRVDRCDTRSNALFD
jgi:DNA modification methylase